MLLCLYMTSCKIAENFDTFAEAVKFLLNVGMSLTTWLSDSLD